MTRTRDVCTEKKRTTEQDLDQHRTSQPCLSSAGARDQTFGLCDFIQSKTEPHSESQYSLTGAGAGLLGLAATSAASVHLALSLGLGADVLEGRRIFVVGVDTSKLTAILRSDALDVDVALALLRALNRRSVPLSLCSGQRLTFPQDL